MSAKENLKEMLLEKSVRTGDFTLASGKKSDLYVDCRLTALDNRGAGWIGEVGWELVKEKIEAENLRSRCDWWNDDGSGSHLTGSGNGKRRG
jgi:orotate phosphoribosyltransferase